jgi:hypothetical protein
MNKMTRAHGSRESRWSEHLAIVGRTHQLLASAAIAERVWSRSKSRGQQSAARCARNTDAGNRD